MIDVVHGEARERLIQLMKDVLDRRIMVDEFCREYERVWNFELKAAELRQGEASLFERVFDAAAWYTPVEEDRKAYPGFKSEEAILGHVAEALRLLTLGNRN
jgi:hypothetical protein